MPDVIHSLTKFALPWLPKFKSFKESKCRSDPETMSSASPFVHSAVSDDLLKTAVARLVRIAINAREILSARHIRLTLETEFACDLTAKKDLILRTIQATLENEISVEERVNREIDEVASIAKRRKLLTMHHSGERPFACDECEYKCAERNNLIAHKRTHTGERPFACDECEYRCAQSSNLTAHKRIHSGERPYACDKCDDRFTQKKPSCFAQADSFWRAPIRL